MKSSKYFSIDELKATLGPELITGQVVTVAHHASSEEGCIRVEFAQQRALKDNNRPAMTDFMKAIARRSPSVLRTWVTMVEDAAQEFVVGATVDDITLKVVDQLTAPYDEATPRLSSEGYVLVNADGLPVFRSVLPALVDEAYEDHIIPVTVSDDLWDDNAS